MSNDKRIRLIKVKCPIHKLSLLIKPGVKFCPACRAPLPKLQRV
jgi:hypothetical protein